MHTVTMQIIDKPDGSVAVRMAISPMPDINKEETTASQELMAIAYNAVMMAIKAQNPEELMREAAKHVKAP